MSEETTLINTSFIKQLFRLGIPLLKLWGTEFVNGHEVCKCQHYHRKSCAAMGKHLAHGLKRSIIQSEEELDSWIADGGNVGISLGFRKKSSPASPLRLIVFDDDDGTGREWLKNHGIESPWVVRGKRGCHLYLILKDTVPPLLTAYNYFKPNSPKLDIKVSGLVVLPLNNGKTLEIDGQQLLSHESMKCLDHFSDLTHIKTWLPQIDPLTIFNKMKSVPPSPTNSKSKIVHKRLSSRNPIPDQYMGNYSTIPYYERRRLASEHAKKSKPSISGQDPWKRLLKIVADCILCYGMSDQTTWEIIRDHFNPRCKGKSGDYYPWSKSEVADAILKSHSDKAFTTLSLMPDQSSMADPVAVNQRLKAKGVLANKRRSERRCHHRLQRWNIIISALSKLGYTTNSSATNPLDGGNFTFEHGLTFNKLFESVTEYLHQVGCNTITKKELGSFLRSIGFETRSTKVCPISDIHQHSNNNIKYNSAALQNSIKINIEPATA